MGQSLKHETALADSSSNLRHAAWCAILTPSGRADATWRAV